MIVVMICFARSGGTMLNKCLGSLPDTIVLSEVNPFGCADGTAGIESYKTIHHQALKWYDIKLKATGFSESILELENHCIKHGKQLIVRDWPFINFSGHHEGSNPPNDLLTLKSLEGKCKLKAFAFVRNAVDVWISRNMKNVQSFFQEYLRYVKAIKAVDVPIFKYEDFCDDPQSSFKSICDYTDLAYHDVTKYYYKFTKMTGDVHGSRGRDQQGITPLPRKHIPARKRYELSASKEMKECNDLMGYQPYRYEGSLLRWQLDRAFSPVRRQAKNLQKHVKALLKETSW